MRKEGLWKILYMSFLFSFFAAGLVAGLFFCFLSFVPYDELVKIIETLFMNPGIISAAIFGELFLILLIIEIFRLVFESGTLRSIEKAQRKAERAEKAKAKKATKKVTKKKTK